MQVPKLTFEESVLVPKMLFDKMEDKLKVKSSLSTLKSEILTPVDLRLKRYDFAKKFRREAAISDHKVSTEAVDSVKKTKYEVDDPREKLNTQIQAIVQTVDSVPKRSLAFGILEHIVNFGHGMIITPWCRAMLARNIRPGNSPDPGQQDPKGQSGEARRAKVARPEGPKPLRQGVWGPL